MHVPSFNSVSRLRRTLAGFFACVVPLLWSGCQGQGTERSVNHAASTTCVTISSDTRRPSISGLARLGPDSYVAVHDSRADAVDAGVVTDRLSVVVVGGSDVLTAWPVALVVNSEDVPRDLESIAAVPGRQGRFFLLESGGDDGLRRLFTCEVSLDSNGGHRAQLTGPPVDLRPYSTTLQNVEGLCVVPHADDSGAVDLLIADRGKARGPEGGAKKSRKPQTNVVQVATITLRDGIVTGSRTWEFAAPQLPADAKGARSVSRWRTASDLVIGPDQGLYVTSAIDAGPTGPFRSLISRVGSIGPRGFVPSNAIPSVLLEGNKVEGICFVALDASGQLSMLAGCDNEELGGAILRVETTELLAPK